MPPASCSTILTSKSAGSHAVPLLPDVSACCFAEAPAGVSRAMPESDSGGRDDKGTETAGEWLLGAPAAANAKGDSELSGRSACWTLPRHFQLQSAKWPFDCTSVERKTRLHLRLEDTIRVLNICGLAQICLKRAGVRIRQELLLIRPTRVY